MITRDAVTGLYTVETRENFVDGTRADVRRFQQAIAQHPVFALMRVGSPQDRIVATSAISKGGTPHKKTWTTTSPSVRLIR